MTQGPSSAFGPMDIRITTTIFHEEPSLTRLWIMVRIRFPFVVVCLYRISLQPQLS